MNRDLATSAGHLRILADVYERRAMLDRKNFAAWDEASYLVNKAANVLENYACSKVTDPRQLEGLV